MLAEHGLDLRRSDAEALVLDELLLAIDDEDVALVVAAADVAGVEPAVADDVGGVLRLVPVAPHHLRAAHADLTHLAIGERPRTGLQIHELVLRGPYHPSQRLRAP